MRRAEFVTPLLVRAAPHVRAGERLLLPLDRLLGVREEGDPERLDVDLAGHVVLVGLGLAGAHAARALAATGVPFVALELHVDNVRRGRREGLPVLYADATSEEALGHAGVRRARLVVLLINDPAAAERVVDTLRRFAPEVPVIVRTRYLLDRERLVALGAREVVAEEVEGTVEVGARLLRFVGAPRNVIDERLRVVRAETIAADRVDTVPRPRLGAVADLAELKIESALVREGSAADGASPIALRLRSETGALVVGVRRGDRLLEEPDPSLPFETGDVVYFVGTGEALGRALRLFDPRGAP